MELEMRQASMPLSLKALIGQCLLPRSWYGALASMLTPVMEQSIYDIRQSIADLGDTEKISGMSIGCGKRSTTERELRKQKGYPISLKEFIKVTPKQMWFDTLAAGIPPEKIDQQPCIGQPVGSLKT